MPKLLALFAVVISFSTIAQAQTETESATLFWKSCMLTDAYKKLAERANTSSMSAQQCQTERDQLQLQRDAAVEGLTKARSDLEAIRAELATAREQTNALNTQLKSASALRFLTIAYGWFKGSRASECATTAQDFLRNMAEFTDVDAEPWGAAARSASCGATVWCSPATDKDGDRYLIWSVGCSDGRSAAISHKLKELPKQLQ